ncbi:ABC transporter substrate-binding protein [Pseudonocardia spinosispora]|uniref:ABC transporter substrate-binding protein n=1 Tax=Pseudonocardia spinosispora TaxID=103441 RepID=UPI0003FC4CA1|nr:ABC transporter substrate-binding protein [Pseudonocardia spinosispora]
MKSRRLLVALAGALALLLPTACSSSSDGPADLSSVTLKVGDQAGIQQALLQASGVLNGTPYKVQWAQFPAAAPLLEALRGGAIDIGIAGDAPTLNALAATKDITVVAANESPARGGLAILVPKDSPIKTVADLRGHTVSPTTQGSIGHYLLLQALTEAGLTAKDVTISFLQPVDAAAAMQSGSIDAWSTWDPYTAVAQQEQGARILRDPIGLASGLSFLDANNDSLADASTRAAMTDFVRRYNTALQWARTNPGENTRIYVQLTRRPEAVAGLVAQRSLRTGVPLDARVVGKLQEVADNYHRYGVMRQPVAVAQRVQDLAAPAQEQR